jgi:hypothetical protein
LPLLLAYRLSSKPSVRVVGPEVGNLECHVGHVLVLVFSLFLERHLGCKQRIFHKGVWPRSRLQSRAGKSVCKGGEYRLPLYVLSFIFENVHVGTNNVL